jgi:hypothetical protein
LASYLRTGSDRNKVRIFEYWFLYFQNDG